MKKSLLLFSAMTCAVAACGQNIKTAVVPSLVMNTFQTTFSNATDIEWEKHKEFYVVDFELGTIEHEVKISPSGKISQQKQDISVSELPKTIQEAVSRKFSKFRIDDADKLEKDGQTYYQVELDKGLMEKKLVFTPDGVETNSFKYWN